LVSRSSGVGKDTVHKVEAIEREAPEEIKQASRRGEISVNKAYQAIRPKEKETIPKKIEHDSEILYKLKSAWKQATKTDKKKFLVWLKKSKELED
jgi:hypothetical protein